MCSGTNRNCHYFDCEIVVIGGKCEFIDCMFSNTHVHCEGDVELSIEYCLFIPGPRPFEYDSMGAV